MGVLGIFYTAGLWIRINSLQIRQFFSMRIRIQLLLKCGSGSSLENFVKK